ncbi:MAG: anti-sigma factor, partial [Acidimicrobiia bacterium]|nr:anti-sigma factor [Acidimicrobiia bacterium]
MELHDLAAGYALGVLEPDEVAQFESHLTSCSACRTEVADLRSPAESLFDAAHEAVPDGLKERVMTSIKSIAQPVPLETKSKPGTKILNWVAAAAVVPLVVAIGLSGLFAGDPIADILASPDATTVAVVATGDAPTAELELVYSPSLGQGVLTGHGLAEAESGMIYQMWLIGGSGPVPAGIFQPDDGA